ncbi:unnamed protein product [Effrenium voratum]|uniref:C3H1-type domain-containing protein n=1 Tax=Effrenium voratum TaxID=2562239 RepID=A0AA36J795_9DINO|nr:unnamed protein product [Effrenium voratum]
MATWADASGEDATVMALAHLLQWSGGSRPASAVGYIYQEEGGSMHRWVVQSHGGVQNFVAAHPEAFVLEPMKPGERCPTIRLRNAWEQSSAPVCHYFRAGRCNKGMGCKFSHAGLTPTMCQAFDNLRMESLRSQVEYYLSDDNLANDAFFQAMIRGSSGGWIPITAFLGCPRMKQLGASASEIVAALRWSTQLQLREWPEGAEEVRRKAPLPEQQAKRAPAPTKEESLEERPLTLLKDCSDGWQAVVEDLQRRSFCFHKHRTASETTLEEEFSLLLASTQWETLRSKAGAVTRSTAWYVVPGCCCRYTYGEASVQPREKPEWLYSIEARILGHMCGLCKDDWPNSVNMNLYEDESQNVGWHSDDEGLFRGCQVDCRIISASWGATRRFEIALKDRGHISGKPSIFHDTLQGITLESGDVCSMEGAFQRHYSHQLAKGAAGAEAAQRPASEGIHYGNARINLTWRYIAIGQERQSQALLS